VVVKGDLTAHGRDDELGAFLDCYQPAFDGRLHWVRGNHDAVPRSAVPATGPRQVTLPGVCLALLDTAVVGRAGGAVDDDQLEWLDQLAAESDRPVLVFGHHHVWGPGEGGRDEGYFGIEPSSSERLAEVVARRPAILGYFAGHTHRNRVRRLPVTGEVPWVEVACTKDFPGGWAEYQVYEGGILQVFHRISASPEALAWTERTRALFGGLYPAYAFGDLGDRCFAIWPRAGAMRR
jgi:3',5'-cyclic AMP phosphodiesterase CpdA